MPKCTCSGCNTVFSSREAFEKHRVGDHSIYPRMPGFKDLPLEIQAQVRHCLKPDEMLAAGMLYDSETQMWASRIMEPEAKERLAKATLRRLREIALSHNTSESSQASSEAFELEDE